MFYVTRVELPFRAERNRSSRSELLCKKDVLENFIKFTGKYQCQDLWISRSFQEHLFYRTPPVAAFEKRLFIMRDRPLMDQNISSVA